MFVVILVVLQLFVSILKSHPDFFGLTDVFGAMKSMNFQMDDE